VSRPLRSAAALAALLLAAAAGAQTLPSYTRTTTCENDPAAGVALWWAGAPPTVTWTLYTGQVPPGCGDLATLEALTAASFATWSRQACSSATSGFAFQHTSANRTASVAFGNDARNLVTWRKGLCSAIAASDSCHASSTCQDVYNCWDETGTIGGDVLALTWVTFLTNGEILDADMELNEWNGLTTGSAGFSYTCSAADAPLCPTCVSGRGGCATASTSCRWTDVGSVVTHEAGHVLGLDHPASGCDPTCAETMAPRIPIGDASKRVLSTEDVRGVCAIYPDGGAAVRQTLATCGTPAPSPIVRSTSKSCGCGGDPSTALWALLGPMLLLRRRR